MRPVLSMVILFLAIINPLQAAEKFLNNQQIMTLINGKSMTFYGTYGLIKFKGEAKWQTNGSIKGKTQYLDKTRHWQGQWYVKNNKYCRSLAAGKRKDTRCHRVKQINANTIQFITPSGKVSSTTIIH